MRAFAVQFSDFKKCPAGIWSPRHWRTNGTCLCDGKPAFEMGPYAVRVFTGGKWVDLSQWLMGQERKSSASTLYHRLVCDGWPEGRTQVEELGKQFSVDHPKVLVGLFGVHASTPHTLLMGGVEVPVCPEN